MACDSVRLLLLLQCPQPCNHHLLLFKPKPSTAFFGRKRRSGCENTCLKKRGLLSSLRASSSSSSSSEAVENTDPSSPEEIITGEWPENFSLLNYDDLRAFLEPHILKDTMEPSAFLAEVMSTTIRTTTVDQTLEDINHHFEVVSGLPVINDHFRCIGVVSKSDKQRASHGLSSRVGEVMSAPAITLSPNKTVLDAAALMLKKKIHRIPIVNEEDQVVGESQMSRGSMVSRWGGSRFP